MTTLPVLNYFFKKPEPVIEDSSKPEKTPQEIPYTTAKNGWRKFSFENMNTAQKDTVMIQCQQEASNERIKALIIGVVSAAATLAVVVTAVVCAHAVAAFFVVVFSAGTWASFEEFVILPYPYNRIPAFTPTEAGSIFFKGTLGLTISGMAAGAGLLILWQRALKNISYHWKYANYLDKQAFDAKLLKN